MCECLMRRLSVQMVNEYLNSSCAGAAAAATPSLVPTYRTPFKIPTSALSPCHSTPQRWRFCTFHDALRPSLRMLTWWIFIAVISISNAFLTTSVSAKDAWQKPGCHRIGHTRKISIPDCIEFHMTTNACRGYCESWAVPSGPKASPTQPVTSVGQCCNIMDSEPMEARVLCVDGIRTLTFKSAITCSCYHCKKD